MGRNIVTLPTGLQGTQQIEHHNSRLMLMVIWSVARPGEDRSISIAQRAAEVCSNGMEGMWSLTVIRSFVIINRSNRLAHGGKTKHVNSTLAKTPGSDPHRRSSWTALFRRSRRWTRSTAGGTFALKDLSHQAG